MKQRLSALLLGLACLANGCVNRYTITLTNNNIMTTRGKPQYDKATDTYKFTDPLGRPGSVPAFRIKEIAPQ